MLIGDTNERLDDPSFVERYKYWRDSTTGTCTEVKYKWAELKSSLLIKHITNNDSMNKRLTIFMQNTIDRILALLYKSDQYSSFANFNVLKEALIKNYMDKMRMDPPTSQNTVTRQYGVVQSRAWLDNTPKGYDREGWWNNLYALINFLKWLWIIVNNNQDPTLNKKCIVSKVFNVCINSTQQHIIRFTMIVKGPRIDIKNPNPKTPKVGVSDMTDWPTGEVVTRLLKRKVRGKEEYKIEPWLHPSKTQCKSPYIGSYGSFIKNSREKNTFNGSLLCGISGSVNFPFFMYLLSTVDTNTVNNKEDFCNLLLIMSINLIGDGGHNIREINTGFLSSIIILNYLIFIISKELQILYKNNKGLRENEKILREEINKNSDNYIPFPPTTPTLRYLYNFILNDLQICQNDTFLIKNKTFIDSIYVYVSWAPFIREVYNLTRHVNIIYITKDQIDKFSPTILSSPETKQAALNFAFTEIYQLIFSDKLRINPNLQNDNRYKNAMHILYGVDNDRYLNIDPHMPSKIIQDCLGKDYDNIIKKVNDDILKIMNTCPKPVKINPVTIPFA
jgi:hypothetical protein